MKKNKYEGSDFRDFLREEGILEEVETRALKKAVALQFERLRTQQSISKAKMAEQMKTSRAAVDRLLDVSNPSVTLATLTKAARVLGRKVKIDLVPV
jgi:antitoxin HicB